jgi:hypothetical protein
MLNPELRTVGFSALIMMKDGRTIEIPPSETVAPRIVIGSGVKGHRVVEVRPPADFGRLAKATAELRFEDFAGNLSFKNSFVFEKGSGPKFFEYDYLDPTRAKYERRVSYLFDNGMQQVAEWQPADGPLLQLAVP